MQIQYHQNFKKVEKKYKYKNISWVSVVMYYIFFQGRETEKFYVGILFHEIPW
jgi:hypothetical protein